MRDLGKIELKDTVKIKDGYFKDRTGLVVEIDEEDECYYVEFVDGNCLMYDFSKVEKI